MKTFVPALAVALLAALVLPVCGKDEDKRADGTQPPLLCPSCSMRMGSTHTRVR